MSQCITVTFGTSCLISGITFLIKAYVVGAKYWVFTRSEWDLKSLISLKKCFTNSSFPISSFTRQIRFTVLSSYGTFCFRHTSNLTAEAVRLSGISSASSKVTLSQNASGFASYPNYGTARSFRAKFWCRWHKHVSTDKFDRDTVLWTALHEEGQTAWTKRVLQLIFCIEYYADNHSKALLLFLLPNIDCVFLAGEKSAVVYPGHESNDTLFLIYFTFVWLIFPERLCLIVDHRSILLTKDEPILLSSCAYRSVKRIVSLG